MRSLTSWVLRIGGVVAILWLTSIAFITPPSLSSSQDQDPKLAFRLKKAVKELDILKKQNEDIKLILKEFTT